MAALEWTSVSKRYGGRQALADVSFALPEGACLGLLGPNGAGKTTALRLALGQTRPDRGQVRVGVGGLDPADPASRVGLGWLPERLALPARARVRGFLRLHARLAGFAGARADDEVEAALATTGLAERAGDALGGLSKGLAQRLGFAQALLGAPRLLLLDEPTSGLDPIGVRDARDWIQAARRRGASVLVSSHQLSEVERTCDHVVILHGGRIAASGRLDEVVHDGETLEDAFLRLVGRGDARS
jgi:ABC-2 type transport system ATP-binding protein